MWDRKEVIDLRISRRTINLKKKFSLRLSVLSEIFAGLLLWKTNSFHYYYHYYLQKVKTHKAKSPKTQIQS